MIELSPQQAAERLVTWLHLHRPLGQGEAGARAALAQLRCIQLDPLDPIGTNADLVAQARVDGLPRGGVYAALLPGHAFEHFAKERCLVPVDRFPAYRARALQAPWWRLSERLARLPEGLIAEVLAEVAARGPLTAGELTDRGRVDPLDWSGWKGTSKAATMALEVLWTRCALVVCGRRGKDKVYDLPERALPGLAPAPPRPLEALLLDRARACGFMRTTVGPWWSGLREARDDGSLDRLLAEGALVKLRIGGARGEFLAVPELLETRPQEPDDRMRILGPLDPLLWDRSLVEQVFGFEYVWEVYKPAAQRRFGWYVVPLLQHGRLVGRMEGHTEAGRIVVDRVWEEGEPVDRRALEEAVGRLGA